MPTRTMYVAVGNFFRRCITHFYHFHIKMQALISQRVVTVYRYGVGAYFCDRNDLALIRFELHTNLNLLVTERIAGHLADQLRVAPSVAFLRVHIQMKFIAF